MSDQFRHVRRQVLRRVRYATNATALRTNQLPPEAPYDAALTNGLLAIIAYEWPGTETKSSGQTKAARELLDVIDSRGSTLHYVDTSILREGLDLTQPARHGRSDDEFAVLGLDHVEALTALDQHPALQFLDAASAAGNIDRLIWKAFEERAYAAVPFDRDDPLPEPEDCDECWRPTFLPSGRDMFGGTNSAGQCIACGHTRTEDEAMDRAIAEAVDRALDRAD
jgi:hypothetical protein